MPSQLTQETAAALQQRILQLHPGSKALWGKMNVNQMLAHCATAIRMAMGDVPVKAKFSPLIAAIARKVFIDWLAFPKGRTPTAPELDIDQKLVASDDFEAERNQLLQQLERIAGTAADFPFRVHPIFRQMNRKRWGQLIYKHIDHHLQQFGV